MIEYHCSEFKGAIVGVIQISSAVAEHRLGAIRTYCRDSRRPSLAPFELVPRGSLGMLHPAASVYLHTWIDRFQHKARSPRSMFNVQNVAARPADATATLGRLLMPAFAGHISGARTCSEPKESARQLEVER